MGSLMLDKAKEIAKTLDAEFLRLFVVDINIPAIQ
ncbi:MAG: GNAT family N-acetyltransferase, partial [Blautia wexlerae]